MEIITRRASAKVGGWNVAVMEENIGGLVFHFDLKIDADNFAEAAKKSEITFLHHFTE